MSRCPLLTKAIIIWSTGVPIPVDLAVGLAALGYDVPTLEARYLA